MPKLTIDGVSITVPQGTSVMQACELLGIDIPRFCYHDKLSIAGSCRMCLVEIEKTPRLAASCSMPCAEGMVVHTNTEAVKKARADVVELTLLNHPLDCPVCDQGGECALQDIAFAHGRSLCRSKESRRFVQDKDLGPLIKTVMTRCIHCTRCLRFMREVAGDDALCGLFRGEELEIASVAEGPLTSELSGNLADLCPVGALTSKPHAFKVRAWELQKTDSIDVFDAVGCAIRVDSREGKVIRVLPRRNDAINDVWINDKTRYACDGLGVKRLERPLARIDGALEPVEWDEAFELVANRLRGVAPYRIAALAGDMVDCESLFALQTLLDALDCPHKDCRQDGAEYDVAHRCSYIMNSSIAGIDRADAVLLIGTNPKREATLVGARLFKRWKTGGCAFGLIGTEEALGFPCEIVGHSPVALRDLLEGKNAFASVLARAQRPMMLVGAGALARADGAAVQACVHELAEKFSFVRDDWNGVNVLQRAASRVGGLDLGFLPSAHGYATRAIVDAASCGDLDVLYLLGADELNMKKPKKTFVVYQGHHADKGAALADVVFPGAAYTEKDALYVNTEGRPQRARRAAALQEGAREDWEIVVSLAKALGVSLAFDEADSLRAAMENRCPHFANEGALALAKWRAVKSARASLSLQPFEPAIDNFYQTDPISRASATMAACAAQILPFARKKEGK